jgi:hypothetical protein
VSDGITFERQGIPAAVICTSAFTETGHASAESLGLPKYPFSIGPHPLAILTPDEVRAWAEGISKEVESLLLRGRLS